MKKSLFFSKRLSSVWLGHLVNFVVVVLSVVFAFWLNNRAIEKDLYQKKQNHLTLLKTSLEVDKASLKKMIELNLEQINFLNSFKERLANQQEIMPKECAQLGNFWFFGVEKSAFEIIKGSDIVTTIENENVLFSVSSVYYIYDEDIEVWQEEYTKAFQRVIEPFLIEKINSIENKIDLDLKERSELINRIYVLEDVLNAVISGYEKGLEELDIAIHEISKELND